MATSFVFKQKSNRRYGNDFLFENKTIRSQGNDSLQTVESDDNDCLRTENYALIWLQLYSTRRLYVHVDIVTKICCLQVGD